MLPGLIAIYSLVRYGLNRTDCVLSGDSFRVQRLFSPHSPQHQLRQGLRLCISAANPSTLVAEESELYCPCDGGVSHRSYIFVRHKGFRNMCSPIDCEHPRHLHVGVIIMLDLIRLTITELNQKSLQCDVFEFPTEQQC